MSQDLTFDKVPPVLKSRDEIHVPFRKSITRDLFQNLKTIFENLLRIQIEIQLPVKYFLSVVNVCQAEVRTLRQVRANHLTLCKGRHPWNISYNLTRKQPR